MSTCPAPEINIKIKIKIMMIKIKIKIKYQMVVHVPCPGEPAPSLLSPLLRRLPVSEITTHPVFVVSAKLVFEVFTNVVPLWVCGTTLRQL